MQDIEQLPLEQWAEQLKQARNQANLELSAIAHTLMLSSTQLRGIESGSLSAFHGPGYYLRAIEKYARYLNITLDPPATELRLTDSQIALNRVKNQPSAANLAKRESLVLGANAMPSSGRGSRLGAWVAGLVLLAIAAGVWVALNEGWPTKHEEPVITAQLTAQVKTPDSTQSTVSPAQITTPAPVTAVAERPSAQPPDSSQTSPQAIADARELNGNMQVVNEPLPAANSAAGSVDSVTQATTQQSGAVAQNSEPAPDPATELTTEPATEPVPEPAPQTKPDMIEATFTADCWVEVRFTDGRVEQGLYKPGQTLSVAIDDVANLTFGNAQAVTATRAGSTFDVLSFTRNRNNVARISGQDLRRPQ